MKKVFASQYCLQTLLKKRHRHKCFPVNFTKFLRTPTCSGSPVFNGRLPFWKGSSRPPVSFWNLPFWVDPCMAYLSRPWSLLKCQIFTNFSQVDHTFDKLEVKILAASNEIRCVYSFWLPFSSTSRFVSTKVLIVLAQAKERVPGVSLRIDTVCNFYTTKSAMELSRLLLKCACVAVLWIRMINQTQCKIQFFRDNLGEKNFLESDVSGFQRA